MGSRKKRPTGDPSPAYKAPPHYSALELRNFRGFRNSGTVHLRPLTLLVGPNSSGKTTVASAMLFLAQSQLLSLSATTPVWIGDLSDLGSFEDTVSDHNEKRKIRIDLIANWRQRTHALSFTFAKSADPIGLLSNVALQDVTSGLAFTAKRKKGPNPSYSLELAGQTRSWTPSARTGFAWRDALLGEFYRMAKRIRDTGGAPRGLNAAMRRLEEFAREMEYGRFGRNLQRVASGRSAPSRWYARTGPEASGLGSQRQTYDGVDPSLVDGPSPTTRHMRTRAPAKLDPLLERLGIASEIKSLHLSAYHSAVQLTDNVTNVASNLMDVGYGASQALPILRALTVQSGSPLVVEQPEIHLHPRAQGELARMLCQTSLKRQVLVETHSDRVINQARLFVAEGLVPPEHVTIIYVDRVPSGSTATIIDLDRNGEFSREWPSGFFDERYEDTMRLLDLRR